MSPLNFKSDQLRNAPVGLYAHLVLTVEAWRRLRSAARLRVMRKRIRNTLRKHHDGLVDTKALALKQTGVFMTQHENLEAAIVNLAYALEDYRDGV
jgi:hypothetical protein